MDTSLIVPFLTYALVTTFTPGPNNVSSSSAGSMLGYKPSLPYLAGIASGFFLLMLTCGLFTDFILTYFHEAGPYIKWAGVGYMLWLALVPFIKAGSKKAKSEVKSYSYLSGLLLQLVNIKVILYGITIYATFSSLISTHSLTVLASAAFLASLSFSSISTWNLVGVLISKKLENRSFYYIFNVLMAVLLLYAALEIIWN